MTKNNFATKAEGANDLQIWKDFEATPIIDRVREMTWSFVGVPPREMAAS